MKTFILLMVAAAAGASCFAQSSLTLTVKPEREKIAGGGCLFEVEIAGKPSVAARKTPINLALVLDRSGSMAGAKLERAKQAACVAIDALGEKDSVSVVGYSDSATVVLASQRVENREKIKEGVRALRDGGKTALYAGVDAGAKQIRNHLEAEHVNRVILLSDGLANVGPSSPKALARLGRELREDGISVTTIGVGDDYNEDLMVALAESSTANYYYVQDAEKLPEIFATELAEVQSLVARQIRIEIKLPDGVQPKAVLGEDDLAFSGQVLRIPLNEFFGSQKRKFVIECTVDRDGRKRVDLAQVDLLYLDAAGREQRQSARASVELTEDARVSERSVVAPVARTVSVVKNRMAKEKALKLADDGDYRAAAGVLSGQAGQNKELEARGYPGEIAEETAKLLRSAEAISSGNWDKRERKSMQFENYQDKHSKR